MSCQQVWKFEKARAGEFDGVRWSSMEGDSMRGESCVGEKTNVRASPASASEAAKGGEGPASQLSQL